MTDERESGARLTEEERLAIGERVCWGCVDRDVWSAVERILAARLADHLSPEQVREREAAAWYAGHLFTGYEPERGENPYRDAEGGEDR